MSEVAISRFTQLKKLVVGKTDSGLVSSLQTLVANIFILLVNILTGILTARVLGPGDKGVQAAIILWPGLLISLATVGLPNALLYHVRKSAEHAGAFLSAALSLGFLASSVSALIGVAFVPTWLSNYSSETVQVTQIYMLFIPMAVLSLIYIAVVQARGDFQTYNGLRLLQPLVTLSILILLIATGTMTAPTAAFAFLCPSVPALFWIWFRTRHLYKFSVAPFKRVYWQLFSYGLRSYSGDVLAVASSQLDKIIVVSLLSPTSMGLYTVAFSLARMLVVFQTAVASVLLPKMIGQPVAEVKSLLGRAVRVSTLVTFCAALGLMLVGPYLINFFYGDEFKGATLVFQILAVDSVLGGLAALLAQIFYALNKPELMIFRHAASLAVTIPGMLILGSKYGISGVATAVLLESVVMVLLTLSAFPTILKMSAPSLWSPKEDLMYISRLWSEWTQPR